MIGLRQQSDAYKQAIRMLERHKLVLREAGADKDMVHIYKLMIDFLAKIGDSDLDHKSNLSKKVDGRRFDSEPDFSDLSLPEIQHMVDSDSTTRRVLEDIAVRRFNVPKGSLRSFSNLDALRGKLNTLIENEKTHVSISQMARNTRV